MCLLLYEFVLLVVLGILSMLVATISGGGNNVILIPILILAYHFSANTAIGTSFLALTAGGLVAGIGFFRKGRLDLKRGMILGLVSIPGVIAGSLFASLAQDTAFRILLALVIIALAVLMVVRDRLISNRVTESLNKELQSSTISQGYKVNLKIGSIVILLIGVFVGVFGQGGGLILIPILQLLGFPFAVTLGTSRLIALLIGGTALATRLGVAQVDITIGVPLAIGAMIGGFLGVEFSSSLRIGVLKWVVATIIVALGALLLLQTV